MRVPKPIKAAKIPKPTKPRSRPNPINTKRKKKLFAENFGLEYRASIVALPCDICGVTGFTEPAHLTSRGAGGKASDLAPLCGLRLCIASGAMKVGCHTLYDDHDPVTRSHEPRLRLLAAERWAAHIKAAAK